MIATPRDIRASLIFVAIYGFFAIIGIPKFVLDAILSHPWVVRGVWLLVMIWLLCCKYYMSATLVALVGLHLSFQVSSSYVFSSQGILEMYRKAQENDPRFDQDSELDLKMANNTLPFDPARWQDPGRKPIPLLLFPPTSEQLSLIGGT